MRRRRLFLYAALALCLPLPALALTRGGDVPPAPAALSVSASLSECGLLETQVVCQIAVSYDAIPDATSYTARVTRADGSVVDYGEVGAGGTSLWVPYVGDGSYSVQVSAYGEPGQSGGRPRLLTRDEAKAGGKAPRRAGVSIAPASERGADEADGSAPEDGAGDAEADETPTPSCEETDPAPEPTAPPVEGEETSGEVAGDAEGPAGTQSAPASSSAPLGDVPDGTAAALQAEGEVPESVGCPSD